MDERVKAVRLHFGYNQDDFGAKIGLSKFAISSYENGKRKLTDRVLSDVCREFNVNERWLRTGEGEMFTASSKDAINQLADELDLDEFGRRALVAYAKLTPRDREAIKEYVLSVAESYKAAPTKEEVIDEKVAAYRRELELEEKTERSSASPTRKDA